MRDSSSNIRDRGQHEEFCLISTSTFLWSPAPGAPSCGPWGHSTSHLELWKLIPGFLTLHGTKLHSAHGTGKDRGLYSHP